MMKVIPKAWSYTFSVIDDSKPVAQAVNLSWWRDKGELRIQDKVYTARREKSSYVLESASGILARTERPRRWHRELVIEHSGHRYTLRAESPFQRGFQVLEGPLKIGSISPDGLFTRKASVDVPKRFPLCLQVYIIWLVMMLWKNEEMSGAG